MEGSLDQPPIVIRTSWRICVIGLLGSGAFLATGIKRMIDAAAPPLMNLYFMDAFFLLVLLFFLFLLISPQTLTAAPDGLTWSTGLRAKHYAWSEIGNFQPLELGALGCDLSGPNTRFGWLRPINKKTTGSHGALGFAWEGGSARVAEILNSARAHWTA